MSEKKFDFDQVIIGSGFGGSVSALRLSEKGYKTLVLERGKRWKNSEFPKTNFNLKKFIWLPRLGLTGFWQVSPTRKLIALRASGVGGGSLLYANTHYIPDTEVFAAAGWENSRKDWHTSLKPFYGLAQRMMGVATSPFEGVADKVLYETARDMECENTYERVNAASFYKHQQEQAQATDPYFSGQGPGRDACTMCAGCMTGCRFNAKNTLDKNYLYFAERNGVEIRPESEVLDIKALEDELGRCDGGAGYELTIVKSTGFFRKKYKLSTRGVVVSAGVLGTMNLLLRAKYDHKGLADISDQLGAKIRCNSETFYNVSFDTRNRFSAEDIPVGMGVNAAFKPDDITMIEPVRFSKGSDAMFLGINTVPLTDKGRLPRPLLLLGNCFRHPISTLKQINPFGKTSNSVLLMIMQSADAFVHARWRRAWTRPLFPGITFMQDKADTKLTTYFPIGQKVAKVFARKSGGDASNVLLDILADIPVSGHLMGGAAIGSGPDNGVINDKAVVFGYQNLRVLDGSVIPGNLGVNPSLTILALSEFAMSRVPELEGAKPSRIKFSAPLSGSVSALNGEGDLLGQVLKISNQDES